MGIETGQTGDFASGAGGAPLYPGIAWKPYYERNEFPWVAEVEARADAVRSELPGLRGQRAFRADRQPQGLELPYEGAWNTYNSYHSGHTFGENCRRCPETVGLLAAVPDCFPMPGIAKFSALSPDTHITAHCGFGNFKLRCHLTLTDAAGCELRVSSEVRRWENGKCLLFDDSFEHEVWNRGERTRIVLLFDFWRPDLSPGKIAILKQFFVFAFTHTHMRDGWKQSQMTMKPRRRSNAGGFDAPLSSASRRAGRAAHASRRPLVNDPT